MFFCFGAKFGLLGKIWVVEYLNENEELVKEMEQPPPPAPFKTRPQFIFPQ